jgi:UDP-N-acetylglucosamine 2-epimerase
MKVASIIGARPQFIKAAAVSKVLRQRNKEIIIHTGQHYDYEMSAQFLQELDIPEPEYNLEVGSGTHGWQTAEMLEGCEAVFAKEKPDLALVYGDTNSTLAGALAAAKMHIPVAHVEAGLRSFNRSMPEEINRVLTDRISSLLFSPTKTGIDNLAREGMIEGVHLVGDVMVDVMMQNREKAAARDTVSSMGLLKGNYHLATIHRAGNTDDLGRLRSIFDAFGQLDEIVAIPLHPRTSKVLQDNGIEVPENVALFKPVGYLDFMNLMLNSKKIFTDSGGIQKEAYILKKACVTMRDETEWVETVEDEWNVVVGADAGKIVDAANNFEPSGEQRDHFGTGDASRKIVDVCEGFLKQST